jgi:hypothetical protein
MDDWNEVEKALIPIKNFQDLGRRWQESLAYPFVRAAYNFSMPKLSDYTHRCLGGDARGRYDEYEALLARIIIALDLAGVKDVLDLSERATTRPGFEALVEQGEMSAVELAHLLQYLTYWFIPISKPLSSLVQDYPEILSAVKKLREGGIRTNLDMLQRGSRLAGRQAIVKASGVSIAIIDELVNRADFSRMPWASKATISNIIGAGYGSLARLAGANPEQLYQDFFRYGAAIGKNLKLGNEIENSHRIAKLVPVVVQEN